MAQQRRMIDEVICGIGKGNALSQVVSQDAWPVDQVDIDKRRMAIVTTSEVQQSLSRIPYRLAGGPHRQGPRAQFAGFPPVHTLDRIAQDLATKRGSWVCHLVCPVFTRDKQAIRNGRRARVSLLKGTPCFYKKYVKCSYLSPHKSTAAPDSLQSSCMKMELLKLGRGRPKKYGREARAVTITLPDDVLVRLQALDADVGRAIVRLVERQGRTSAPRGQPAELSRYGNHAVILVKPAKALKRLPGVQLVPVGNGRALVSLDAPLAVSQLELAVRDALEGTAVHEPERQILQGIVDILRQARSSRTVSVEERTIIVLVAKRRPVRTDAASRR